MVSYPRIESATAIDDHTLVIEFNNKQQKKYDITPLLKKKMFSPLRNIVLFKTVQVERGGYAIFWNDKIDISEYELWTHGQTIP
ncbi:DUF2442 domain-containing protein [Candidatus Venteria ishoeyi]|uniref:DUF2442 domain-containing protein n=1 Tax=Candidatus Venteria ishoeyi TaxID=1899563 RepID=UPI0025A4D373|nr:DUF2442 domain-containing protein [Candidatus Venteria ishoeyi]MDM8546339.1 DUF2442 domain-containing protein [Candidatus Venteria ishoeyi]